MIDIPEPGNPAGDPVFSYEIRVKPAGHGFAHVVLPKWPDHPIGYVQREPGGWEAFLSLPPEGRVADNLGARPLRRAAIQLVVEAYHWRYAKRKVSYAWERDHEEPVERLYQVLPPVHGFPGVPESQTAVEAQSSLHRFLALNRWLFDAPAEIRPYQPEES